MRFLDAFICFFFIKIANAMQIFGEYRSDVVMAQALKFSDVVRLANLDYSIAIELMSDPEVLSNLDLEDLRELLSNQTLSFELPVNFAVSDKHKISLIELESEDAELTWFTLMKIILSISDKARPVGEGINFLKRYAQYVRGDVKAVDSYYWTTLRYVRNNDMMMLISGQVGDANNACQHINHVLDENESLIPSIMSFAGSGSDASFSRFQCYRFVNISKNLVRTISSRSLDKRPLRSLVEDCCLDLVHEIGSLKQVNFNDSPEGQVLALGIADKMLCKKLLQRDNVLFVLSKHFLMSINDECSLPANLLHYLDSPGALLMLDLDLRLAEKLAIIMFRRDIRIGIHQRLSILDHALEILSNLGDGKDALKFGKFLTILYRYGYELIRIPNEMMNMFTSSELILYDRIVHLIREENAGLLFSELPLELIELVIDHLVASIINQHIR